MPQSIPSAFSTAAMEKALDRSKLTRKQVMVSRGGKVYQATRWVKPEQPAPKEDKPQKPTVYRDALGGLEYRAFISRIGDKLVFSTTSDAPQKTWPVGTKPEDIASEMDRGGWDAVISQDMRGFPKIILEHRQTKKMSSDEEEHHIQKWRGAKEVYIRFGDIPESGQSTDWSSGRKEKGVSVFRGKILPNGEILPLPGTNQELGSLLTMNDRPLYVIEGEEVGTGADGEPVLANAKQYKPKDAAKRLYKPEVEKQVDEIRKQYENTDKWMKAPNGQPTKLNEQQWLQVRTPAFKKWFEDWENDPDNASKVVDENGEPLVVYHGSPDLRELKKQDTFMSQRERFGMGKETHVHWFTPSMGSAKTYADPHRAFDYQNAEEGVVTVYLKIENPLIVDAEGQAWRDAQRRGKTSDVIMEAMNTGHDGLIIRNVKDEYNNGPKTKPSDTYAVFSPEQIKSVDNEGSWSAKDRRIHKSLTWSGWKLQGRMNIHGMDISIENRKGSTRRGKDKDGHAWKTKMHADYGYIRGTVGRDKDHVDCYVGPNRESTRVFIVHQNDPTTGKYDEDKVMLGFNTPKEAKELYLKQYDRPGFFGSMDETDIDTFKEKAFSDNAKGRKIVAKAFPTAGYQANIEKETEGNSNFRRVLFTGPYSQLVVMNLKPGEDIGIETHERLDQFIRIEAGEGTSIIDGKERELKPGDGLIIPAGSAHNIIATTTLKLYAVYTKPEHPDKLIVKAKPKRLVVPALIRKRIGTNNQAGGHVV